MTGRLGVFECVVMLELVADSSAYVAEAVSAPGEFSPCATNDARGVEPGSHYGGKVVARECAINSDSIKVRVAYAYRVRQGRADTVGNAGNPRFPLDHPWFDAVNGDVYIIEVVLGVDEGRPGVRESAIRERREPDLAN